MWKIVIDRKLPISLAIKSLSSLVANVSLLWLLCWASANAQTAVTRYLPINNSIMPFTAYVAPTTISTVVVDGIMNYNIPVTTANVTWTSVADADQYKLEHLNTSSGQWSVLYDGPNIPYMIENLSLGVHTFRVIACGGGLCGQPSAVAQVLIEENTDLDLDGVIDEYDLCLGTIEEAAVSAAGCPPTTTDSDSDGITDDLDWCAATDPNDPSINARGCSPDQIDADEDGTADYLDAYPHQNDTQCTG